MMAPFALQAANCSLASPLTPRKLVSFRDMTTIRPILGHLSRSYIYCSLK